jgi:PilZ domain
MDNRRHPRLNIQLPIRFIVEQPETRDSQAGQGMMKNISYGGILFQVEPPLPVKPGQVREFSFYLEPGKNKERDLTHFEAKGLVLRIEPPDPNSSAYGVAVQFLSALKKEDVIITLTISPRLPGTRSETL